MVARSNVAASTAAALGVSVGLVGAALFLALHAVVVRPIFGAAPRGLAVALVAGTVMGLAYRAARGRGGLARGASFGALAALTVAPFLVAGEARSLGASPLAWGGALAALLALWLAAVARFAVGHAARAAGVAAALLVLNAYPAFFLLFLGTIIDDRVPNPFPMTATLMLIYVACGVLLEAAFAARATAAEEEQAFLRRFRSRRA